MKVEDALASDDFNAPSIRSKSSGFCSKLWFFLKFMMFGALLSVVLTLVLVFCKWNLLTARLASMCFSSLIVLSLLSDR